MASECANGKHTPERNARNRAEMAAWERNNALRGPAKHRMKRRRARQRARAKGRR